MVKFLEKIESIKNFLFKNSKWQIQVISGKGGLTISIFKTGEK